MEEGYYTNKSYEEWVYIKAGGDDVKYPNLKLGMKKTLQNR